MKRSLLLAVVLSSVEGFGQNPQKLPDDLNLLVGKKVVIGRMPLCQPNTYNTNLNYSGKQATVVSLKPGTVHKFPPNMLNRLTPEMRAQMEDMQKAATLLFQFEDGTKLDSCAPVGPTKLAESLALAPGETLESPKSSNSNTAASTSSTAPSSAMAPAANAPASAAATPQDCPVMVTKLGHRNFAHG